MSKVSIEFDTRTDELSVVVDGKKVENVESVNIYSYMPCCYDRDDDEKDKRKVSISITSVEEPEEDDDVKKYIHLAASVKEDIKPTNMAKTVYRDIEDFLGWSN